MMCSRPVRAAAVRSGFSKGAKRFSQNSPRKFRDRRKVPHASLFFLVLEGMVGKLCGFVKLYTGTRIVYAESPMWNVNERFEKKAIDSMAALGFGVGSTRGVVRVEKYGSGAEFRQEPDGRFHLTVLPTIMLKGKFTRLWDAGYQKFLLTDEGLKVPALATHLENLRMFNEELRTALGVPTFYNEALGSVSQVSVYDRVKGRKGDIPDETVGAHKAGGGH